MPTPFETCIESPDIERATERQLSYLRDLMMKKAAIKGITPGQAAMQLDLWFPTLTRQDASNQINKAAQWLAEQESSSATDIDDGFYELSDGRIVKVVHAVHGSGRQYGKVRDTQTGGFSMERGIVAEVRTKGTKLTLARAQELGHLYGMCVRCGATLTDETSIANGIGPICASRFS
ncbi:MAG: hypothetical protein JOY78_13805 [Pseudonocardia sp.]|nr:hypothetical protein [Pseudonocardia sp.]